MKNSIQLVRQLKQDVFPLFCNEGVFRMLVDIFLQKQDQFQNLIQTLGDFCTAKCLKHGIGLYIRRSALRSLLIWANTHIWSCHCWFYFRWYALYMDSLKRLLILANADEKLKWSVFTQTVQSDGIKAFEGNMRGP